MSGRLRMPSLHRITPAIRGSGVVGPPRVVVLFNACRPANVARLVVAVVVNAVKCQFGRWSRTNVGKERLETIAPTLADSDATTSVVSERWTVRVLAPLADTTPNVVLRSVAHSVCALLRLAPTRGRLAYAQAANEHITLCAAHASAREMPQVAISWRGFGQHGPVTDNSPWRYATDQ
jgi:hypothetical protein